MVTPFRLIRSKSEKFLFLEVAERSCSAKSTCQSPILRDNRAISGDVPQKVCIRARFCGTTRQFRAMSRKKYMPGPGFAGQRGKVGRCLAERRRGGPILRDNRAISGDVPQKVHARARFCGTGDSDGLASRRELLPGREKPSGKIVKRERMRKEWSRQAARAIRRAMTIRRARAGRQAG